ncbi:MAG: iron-sulfur cluster assembly scaffold protein [Candidatus Fermentibacteraceae bacterium]|nr:iron-sulfur cluster assembly scaffold protein [Candidatus Fermentibacteraceae bacterium]MBN2608241.1 iron-sulfur cluster assembly scaffold protein [Candidatus Fermentibacteraceae bacterium]
MWKYSKILMDHFMNPRNSGQLPNPDAHSEVGSPQCGDAMTLDLRVDDQDRISDIRFMTFGCAGAIAAASALTELARGKTLEDALSITNDQIVEYLGGMPEEKYHCSVMGHEALTGAVADFRSRKERVRRHLEELMKDPPEELHRELTRCRPELVHVHPSRVVLRITGSEAGRLRDVLERELTARVGRKMEVEVSS